MSACEALEHDIFKLGADSSGSGNKKTQVVLENLLHYRVRQTLFRSK